MSESLNPVERAIFELAAQFRRMGRDFEVDTTGRLNDAIARAKDNENMDTQAKNELVHALEETKRLLGLSGK